MQRFLTSLALIFALGLSAENATALGFGEVASAPVLGQPLNFTVGLRLDPNESLEGRCVQADIHFGEHVLSSSQVRSRIETQGGTGERRIRITTTAPIDEPVVTIQLKLGCPSRLSRGFLLFADPPERMAVAGRNTPAESGWIDASGTQGSEILSAVPARPGASAARQSGNRRATASTPANPSRAQVAANAAAASAASTDVPDGRMSPRLPRKAPVVKAPSRGSVLRLDPIESDALILPSLRMATTLSMPASGAASGRPAYVDPDQEQRLRDLERLKGMESALVKLRGDSQATQKLLDEAQKRVEAAEAKRYANPLVYGLVLLSVLLAVGLGVVTWLRRRDRLNAVWWTGGAGNNVGRPTRPPDISKAPVLSMDAALETPPPVVHQPDAEASALSPLFAPPTQPPQLTPSVPGGLPIEHDLPAADPRRPMSAEELIDLEQQAEFFVVLGQDDAAIDLLMGHVRSTGGVSPLPYMKLLEIYRRRNEREAYDRIRERFNRRFNAYASEWDVDPESGLNLEAYPEVMGKLQKHWESPGAAMELLDAALFRRDAGPTFDVPAYRELLFLYGIARDLSEKETQANGVDLLLPIGDQAEPTVITEEVSQPAEGFESASFSLDLDVSSESPPLSRDHEPLTLEERPVESDDGAKVDDDNETDPNVKKTEK